MDSHLTRDLTLQSLTAVCVSSTETEMQATVCNRGVVHLDIGVQVTFDQIEASGDRTRLCDLRTTSPIAPGACTTLSCVADVPADGTFVATADDESLIAECNDANNIAESEADCLE